MSETYQPPQSESGSGLDKHANLKAKVAKSISIGAALIAFRLLADLFAKHVLAEFPPAQFYLLENLSYLYSNETKALVELMFFIFFVATAVLLFRRSRYTPLFAVPALLLVGLEAYNQYRLLHAATQFNLSFGIQLGNSDEVSSIMYFLVQSHYLSIFIMFVVGILVRKPRV